MADNIITFLHSGDGGDIIAGLATVKEICENKNAKAYLILDTTGGMTCNDDELNKIVSMQSRNVGLKFNDKMYDFLEPLISVQPYIAKVVKWNPNLQINIDFNLNEFRRSFCNRDIAQKTNQNLMYLHQISFGLNFKWKGPWLFTEKIDLPKKVAVVRSCRYHSAEAYFCYNEENIGKNAYFIGTDLEYAAFSDSFKIPPERYQVKTALDAAKMLNSMDQIVANATLFYWIAVALGKNVIHEFPLDMPKTTYFTDCPNIIYIQGAHRV